MGGGELKDITEIGPTVAYIRKTQTYSNFKTEHGKGRPAVLMTRGENLKLTVFIPQSAGADQSNDLILSVFHTVLQIQWVVDPPPPPLRV